MATADEYAEWIVKNHAKKGTPEFETVAQAYREAKGTESQSPVVQAGAPQPVSVIGDVVKSIPGAVPRAAAGLVGLPQTVMSLIGSGVEKVTGAPAGTFKPELPNIGDVVTRGYDALSNLVTGSPMYRPQTGVGRVVDQAAQTMVGGPGSMVAKGTVGAVSGVTGEAARLSGIENPIALGVLQMLGASAASLPFILRSVPADTINQAIRGITPQQLTAAQALMDRARAMGTPITGAEAIAQITGKNTLQDVQRVVESSSRGGPVMQPMMNARPDANRAAVEAQVTQGVGPPPANPAQTPVRMQTAAETAINRARQEGNAQAAPDYATANTQSVTPSQWNALTQQPAAQRALDAVRRATEWGVTNEREGSIAWLDAAKRWLDAQIQNRNTTPAERRIWEQGRADIVAAADQASAAYRNARATVAQNRRDVVAPMEASPVGDIAASRGPRRDASAEAGVRAQSEILMPQAPRALDPPTIRTTVATLNRQDPDAARNFVSQNIRAIFDETTQNLVGGQNQWGGAKFAAQIAGNPRQRDNLQALIESAGGGPQAWVGFNRLLEVLEAQGKRLPPGSPTAQNLRLEGQLSAGGIGTLPAAAASPTKALSMVGEWYDNFRYGRNTEAMARILTDPRSVALMRQLAREAPHSDRAAALTAQIIAVTSEASN